MRLSLGIFIGLLLGASLAVGYHYYLSSQDPCLGRCGDGTECQGAACVPRIKKATKKKRRRRYRRRRRRRRRARAGDAIPALRQVPPGERRAAARGPSLRGTDYVDLSSSGGEKELSTEQVNQRFRKLDRRIVGCIDRARSDFDLRDGRVLVGFRIERSGKIQKVRVTAPLVLQKTGLYACIRPLVTGLRFPASSRSLIMRYPFELD